MLNAFSILGVPTDNFDSKEFVQETLMLIENPAKSILAVILPQ